ncbi:MAG: fibronectin type III domain-containing protein [Ferruginibacter sp.]
MSLKLKNGFNEMADDTLLTRAYQIVTAMTGNDSFPTPTPSVADMETIVANFFEALSNCTEADRVKIAIKNQARKELIDALHKWALYVMLQSNDDVAVAMTSGFQIAKAPSPAPPLEKPVAPVLQSGINSGQLLSKNKRVLNAVSYVHQYATEAEMIQDNWKSVPYSKSSCVFTNLVPGTKYYCRLVVVGRKGQLVYSDVVSRIAA